MGAIMGLRQDEKFSELIDAAKSVNTQQEVKESQETPPEDADIQFLQDVIDRKEDILADGFYEKLEAAAKKLISTHEALVSEAVDAYTDQTDEYAQQSEKEQAEG